MRCAVSDVLDDNRNVPLVTDADPGIGGRIKSTPSHFVVEEIPLYEPSGEGEHVYVRLTREGRTTRDVVTALARALGVREGDVGYAGMKDKHAQTTQTFSILLRDADPGEMKEKIESEAGVTVHWAKRHRNKLKAGHLIGNRFRIVIAAPAGDAAERVEKITASLRRTGVPNYYGEQRFGLDKDNAQKGRDVILGRGGPRQKWLTRFLASAFQSALFNLWLGERIRRGEFTSLLRGDIARKVASGGIFEVEDEETDRQRFEAGELTYTGPIYGWKMRWAGGEPGERERAVLDASGVSVDHLKSAGLRGSRRAARLSLPDLTWRVHEEGLEVGFTLPKGAFATVVLREIMKSETDSSRR